MGWVAVDDIKGTLKSGKPSSLKLDGYLLKNLDDIPRFLKLAYDCVGIISGHGKVRIGKSSMAIGTVGSYVAWRLAGGKCRCHQETIEGKEKWVLDYLVHPKRKVKFDLYENIAFNAEELQDKATKLYDKYGKNQILVYDEGRQGLDSARAMEAINKGMQDFFQTCGMMGHVILIVLPNFFKLHEDYAVARSLFLIDVYADRHHERGYYSFYNEIQKEKLYYFGKKRIGVRAKYDASNENFWGKFSSLFPFDREEYDKLKRDAIKKIKRSQVQQKYKRQRDAAFFMLKKNADLSSEDIANEISAISRSKVSGRSVRWSIAAISRQKVEDID